MSVVATTNFAKQTALIGVLLNSCISLGRTTSLHTASSDPWTTYLTLWSLSPVFCDFHHPDPLIKHISICPGPQGHMTYDTGMHDSIPCGLWCLFHQQGPRQLQEAQDAGQHVKRQGDVGLAFLFEMRSHHSPLLLLPKRIKHRTLIFWKSRIWRAHYYCQCWMSSEMTIKYNFHLAFIELASYSFLSFTSKFPNAMEVTLTFIFAFIYSFIEILPCARNRYSP